jgi:hypothetical protein
LKAEFISFEVPVTVIFVALNTVMVAQIRTNIN